MKSSNVRMALSSAEDTHKPIDGLDPRFEGNDFETLIYGYGSVLIGRPGFDQAIEIVFRDADKPALIEGFTIVGHKKGSWLHRFKFWFLTNILYPIK